MAGVDDERKAADYIRRFNGNPWFALGIRAYGCFARIKGFCLRFCSWWAVFLSRILRITSVLALSAFLIFASSFAPIDTKGWSNVRRAYAVVGVDDAIFGTIVAGVLLTAGAYVVNQSGVSYAGIADDFRSWASENLTNTIWENGSEWVNPTASGSGYTVDISQVPDSVLKGVMDYGAHLGSSDNVPVGSLPSVYKPNLLAVVNGSGMSDTVTLGSGLLSAYQSYVTELPYVYMFEDRDGSVRDVTFYVANMPLGFQVITNSRNKYGFRVSFPAGVHYRQSYQRFNYMNESSVSLELTDHSADYVRTYSNATSIDITGGNDAVGVWQSAIYTAAPIAAGVPDAISTPIEAYQADPTDENAQVAIDAIRAANPSVALPEEAPQTINNYNEYVTVNNGSGEVVDPDTPADYDLTGLPDAIAQALGGGATIASVLAALRSILDGMVTSDALAGEFSGIDSLLRQLVNLEQRAEQWRQQQELNADLDEIIRLLTSIDENVSAILGDMANLDRSTGDLVNLQPVIDAIDGLQIPGDPVATDLSSLEHQMLDMTDEDGVTLTVHGLLHWINYYLQDIDRFLHSWNPYDPIDYSTVLGNIYDEISAFTDSFTQFWEDFDNYLDAVLWDLEHLQLAPRTPHAPYPTPLPNPETGIVPWEDMLNLNALRDAITRMMQKFPFATINNFVLILTMLVRPAQAPQFDLPLPNPSDWSDPYMVHVDLSIWDVPAAVLRTGTMLWAIARVSRRTVALWTSEEGGGEGA